MRTRRNFSAEFKAKVVLEALSGAKSAAEICREHNLKPDLLSHWKNQFLANASKVFENSAAVDPQQERALRNWRNWQASKAWRSKS
jgi:transposase